MSTRLASGAEAVRSEAGPGRLAMLVAGAALFNYLGASIALEPPDAEGGLSGFNPINAAIQSLILVLGLSFALRQPRQVLALGLAALPFLLLIGLAAASLLWSQLPGNSLRRAVGMTAQLLLVLYLHAELGPRRALRFFLTVVLVAVALSLLEALFRPAIGFDVGEYSNAIRGVFPAKNSFGAALLHGMLALSLLMLMHGRATARHLAVAGVLLVALVLARSATALVLSLLVLGLTGAWLAVRAGGAWLAVALLGAGLTLALALGFGGAFGPEGFFDLLGKDETLTGRTEIWASVDRAIAARPWLGHGMAAFWIRGLTPAELIWLDLQWLAPDAHSAWREVVLQLGWLGLAVTSVVAALTLGVALWRLAGPRRAFAFWVLILLLVGFLHGNAESAWLRGDTLLVLWLLGWLGLVRPMRELERPG